MIEVGEYVRCKDGEIHKIIQINNPNDELWTYYKFENNMGNYKENIVNHSKNIIDLIEEGDYVNGYKVSDKESTLLCTKVTGIDRSGYHIPISQYGDGIKTILTRESYMANCYKVGGEQVV